MASEEEDTEVSFHPRYAGGADPEMSSSSSDDEFSDASDQVMHVASETPGIEMGDAPERHDQDPFYPCHMGDVASLARGGVPRRQAGPETSKFIAPDPPRSSLNRGPKTNEFPSKGGPAINGTCMAKLTQNHTAIGANALNIFQATKRRNTNSAKLLM